MEKTRTVVQIAGMTFKLSGTDSEEYIKKIAAYLNKKIDEVQAAYPSLSTINCALLAALNITDELHKLHEAYEAMDSRIDQLRNMPRSSSASMPVKRPFDSANIFNNK